MGSFWKVMHGTLKDTIVGTLDLCFRATNNIEKVCWLLLGVLGSICMAFIVIELFESMKLNPTMSSRSWVETSKIGRKLLIEFYFLMGIIKAEFFLCAKAIF